MKQEMSQMKGEGRAEIFSSKFQDSKPQLIQMSDVRIDKYLTLISYTDTLR